MTMRELRGKPFKEFPIWPALCAQAVKYGHPFPPKVGDCVPSLSRGDAAVLDTLDINTLFAWSSIPEYRHWSMLHHWCCENIDYNYTFADMKPVADVDGNLLFDFSA